MNLRHRWLRLLRLLPGWIRLPSWRPERRHGENPASKRPYLAKPDYYRLGYQLSAQLLNRAHAVVPVRLPAEREQDLKEAVLRTVLGRDQGAPIDEAGAAEALRVADGVLSSAREMSCWYRERERRSKWRFWARLDEKDKRMMHFLASTAEPCLELVIAAAAPLDHFGYWVSIDLLRQRVREGRLSYRAIYNLACHEARGGVEIALALAYLRLAFRLAPADRRRELVKWAGKDPSLGNLYKDPEFVELLVTFGAPSQLPH